MARERWQGWEWEKRKARRLEKKRQKKVNVTKTSAPLNLPNAVKPKPPLVGVLGTDDDST